MPGTSLKSQMTKLPYPTKKWTGQTIIVTGSNTGLGLEAARHFVRLDAKKLIIAVRSPEKGEEAKKDIEESTKRKDVIEVWKLDLGNYQSVKDFAKRAQGLERLDVLVENAGVLTFKFTMQEDNETSITTNTISPLLHALLLIPKMRETAVKFNTLPKIVFTTSFVHWDTRFPEQKYDPILEALADEKKARMDDRYRVSKLLEMYGVQEIAKLVTASQNDGRLVVNHVNPGWVSTSVMREWSGVKLAMFKLACKIAARTTEEGSRTLVNAAEGGEETHGEYLDDCQIGKRGPLLVGEKGATLQKRVWTELATKFEAIQPGVLQGI